MFSKVTVYGLDFDGRGSIPYMDIDFTQHLTQSVPRAVFLEGEGGGGSGVNRTLICHTQLVVKLPVDSAQSA